MMGKEKAKWYHLFLFAGAIVTGITYTVINFKTGFQLLFLLAIPLFLKNIFVVMNNAHPLDLNKELRNLSISTLVFSMSFGIGLIL
jgi:1,4-dihydroxy-2-naphthoate polyprenyltransferase